MSQPARQPARQPPRQPSRQPKCLTEEPKTEYEKLLKRLVTGNERMEQAYLMSEDYAVNFQNKGKEVISYGAGKDIVWPIEQSCLTVDILNQIDNPQMLALFKSGLTTTEHRH
jgi:hypothetical protein